MGLTMATPLAPTARGRDAGETVLNNGAPRDLYGDHHCGEPVWWRSSPTVKLNPVSRTRSSTEGEVTDYVRETGC